MTILPFISVTALVASSGEEKQPKPKPLLRPSSFITLALVTVPWSKLFPKPLIVNGVVKVLDVEVDALVSVQPFQLQLLELLLQLPLMLGLSGSDSGWQSLLAFLQLLPGVYADKCSSTAF